MLPCFQGFDAPRQVLKADQPSLVSDELVDRLGLLERQVARDGPLDHAGAHLRRTETTYNSWTQDALWRPVAIQKQLGGARVAILRTVDDRPHHGFDALVQQLDQGGDAR